MTVKPQILAISSFVTYGTVGLRAIGPALEALSCELIAQPSVVLSNHPGHAHTARVNIAADEITASIGALNANGWLDNLAAVLTGYLPTPRHVTAVRETVTGLRARNGNLTYVLDPILGDDPKGLYIDEAVAGAIRDTLVDMAGVITPNRFELSWLTGRAIAGVDDAIDAARTLAVPAVVATSIPMPSGQLATVLVTRHSTSALALEKRQDIPHGTGDLLAGLLTGYLARGHDLNDAFIRSHGVLAGVIQKSHGRDRLDLSALTACANVP